MHMPAARTNELTNDDIQGLTMQSAVYRGVPNANTAFRIAPGVLQELDADEREG
jgi:3-oxoadipate enol-lactonase/4-carboxymuconolactone decarboxylase